MTKLQIIIPFLLLGYYAYGQSSDYLIIHSFDSGRPIKNANVISNSHDTVLISDTSGLVILKDLHNYDSLIIKKFGYLTETIKKNTKEVVLKVDSNAYSHNLKLLNLKHKDGYSFIELRINSEDFWFKQKIGPLILGNGREIDNLLDYKNIFKYHEILKTVSVAAEGCLDHIIGENSANWIMAIYYNPKIINHKTDKYPNIAWYSKHSARKDVRKLRLTSGCLD